MFRNYEDTLKQIYFCCGGARASNNQNYWPEWQATEKKELYQRHYLT